MNIDQIMYELTYWFDFSIRVVLNHPLISVAAVLVAFFVHQAVGAMKLIGVLLALVTAFLLGLLMF